MGIYSWYFAKNWSSSNGDFLIVLEMFGHVSTDIPVIELMLILPK